MPSGSFAMKGRQPSPPAMPGMGPLPEMSGPPQQNFSPQQFSAPSAPVSAPPAQAAPQVSAPSISVPPVTVNQAQTDPRLNEYLDRVRKRLDNPGDDTRALNQAGQAINQFAQGQRNMAVGDLARRGVLTGGAGSEQGINTDISNVAQGNFAKAAEGIAIQRARDEDALLMGSQNAFAEPGRQGLADRGLGIQQAALGQQGQLAAADMNLRAQLANQEAARQAQQMNFQQNLAAQQLAQQQQAMALQYWGSLYAR